MEIDVLENTVDKQVWGVCFSGAGKQLAAGGSRGYDLWDVATRERVAHLPSHVVGNGFFGCELLPDGRLLVSDTKRGFRVLEPDGAEVDPPGSPYEKHVRDMALSKDGECLILSRGGGGRTRIEHWRVVDREHWEPVWSLSENHLIDPWKDYSLKESVTNYGAVALAADEPWLCHLWEANPAQPNKISLAARPLEDPTAVRELGQTRTAFPSKLMRGFRNSTVVVWDPVSLERWDLASGESTHLEETGRSSLVAAVMHPTEPLLVTATSNGKLQRRSIENLALMDEHPLEIGNLLSLDVSPDGLVAAGSKKGLVALCRFPA